MKMQLWSKRWPLKHLWLFGILTSAVIVVNFRSFDPYVCSYVVPKLRRWILTVRPLLKASVHSFLLLPLFFFKLFLSPSFSKKTLDLRVTKHGDLVISQRASNAIFVKPQVRGGLLWLNVFIIIAGRVQFGYWLARKMLLMKPFQFLKVILLRLANDLWLFPLGD